jgi:hypothetical protein
VFGTPENVRGYFTCARSLGTEDPQALAYKGQGQRGVPVWRHSPPRTQTVSAAVVSVTLTPTSVSGTDVTDRQFSDTQVLPLVLAVVADWLAERVSPYVKCHGLGEAAC